jgi:kelch-like protein 18
VFDPIIGRWQLAEAMSMLRSRVGVAVMRNRLYAFGGYNGHERLSTVEVFDPQKRAWSRVSPMHFKRRLVHIITLSSFLGLNHLY